MDTVPIVDLAGWFDRSRQESVAREVDNACSLGNGFFYIKNHGVDQKLIDDMFRVNYQFYQLPLNEKLKTKPDRFLPRGYIPDQQESAEAFGDENGANVDRETGKNISFPGDMCEMYSVGNDTPVAPSSANNDFWHAKNIFPTPDVVDGFESTWKNYFQAMTDLLETLLKIAAVALGLDVDHFVKEVDLKSHAGLLRTNYYYALGDRKPVDRQWRRGPHKDSTLFTILIDDNPIGGLQVLGRNGYFPVERPPNTFVVNIGDCFNLWTNGKWMSQFHRVGFPSKEQDSERMVIVMFNQPSLETIIRPLPQFADTEKQQHPEVRFGDWYAERYTKLSKK